MEAVCVYGQVSKKCPSKWGNTFLRKREERDDGAERAFPGSLREAFAAHPPADREARCLTRAGGCTSPSGMFSRCISVLRGVHCRAYTRVRDGGWVVLAGPGTFAQDMGVGTRFGLWGVCPLCFGRRYAQECDGACAVCADCRYTSGGR